MHASTWHRMPRAAAECRELGDRVDDAVRVRRRARDHQHGPVAGLVERGLGRGDVGREVGADRHQHRLHAEVVRGLVERRVRGCRQHHAGLGHVRMRVARRLHREQHRLGAARGHGADRGVGPVEQAEGEADQVVLHPEQAGERRRVEPVGAGVRRDRLASDPVDVGQAGVVDVGERPAAVHREVARLERLEPFEGVGHAATGGLVDLVGAERVAREPHQADHDQQSGQHREAQRDRGLGGFRLGHVAVGARPVAARGQHEREQPGAEREAEGLAGGPHAGVDADPGARRSAARRRPRRRGASPSGRPARRRTRPRPAPPPRRPGRTAPSGPARSAARPPPAPATRSGSPASCRSACRGSTTLGSAAGPGRRSRRRGSSTRPCGRARRSPCSRRRPACSRWRGPAPRRLSAAAGSPGPPRRSAAGRAGSRRRAGRRRWGRAGSRRRR